MLTLCVRIVCVCKNVKTSSVNEEMSFCTPTFVKDKISQDLGSLSYWCGDNVVVPIVVFDQSLRI